MHEWRCVQANVGQRRSYVQMGEVLEASDRVGDVSIQGSNHGPVNIKMLEVMKVLRVVWRVKFSHGLIRTN